jgi:gliding motility-associated-like protein
VEIEFENISQDATTFEWTLPDGSTSTNVNSSFYFTEAGLFEITLVANSTETCNLSDTITKIVKIEENVVETLAALHYCLGDSILVGFSPSGNPNVSYLWDNSTFLTESNISNPLAFPDETTTFILSSIEGSCIDTSYQTVYVHTLNFNLSVDDNSICQGDTAILILETDGSYHDISWAIDPGFNNSFNYIDTILPVSPDTTQIYYLNITNQYCDILSEETVFVSAIYIEPLQDYTICIYDYLEIVAENTYPGQSYFFDWKPEEIVIEGASTSSPLIYTEEQTSVFVEIENQEGCKLVDTVEIFISEFSLTELEVYADDDTIYYGQSTILHTNQFDNLNFQWFPAHYLNADTIAEPTASPTENTVFSAFVNDEFSCEKNDSVEIVVLDVFCNEDYVFVPNAFTPNDDGHNDILYVYSEMVRDIFFAIYDRWGKMVFSTKDITKGWDGTYKNKELDPAVFVYYLEVTCWDYSNFSKKGNITLLR